MMASSCNLNCCLTPGLSVLLLALVWTGAMAFVTESTAPIQLTGEIGGNVTFHCNFDKQKNVEFMYFQKGDTFVNGFHNSKPLPETWKNTKINKGSSEITVDMKELNITHEGQYMCHIKYTGEKPGKTPIELRITAKYSKPTITISCNGGSCLVTCASHGGFPETEMMWTVPVKGNTSSHIWKVVNSSKVRNQDKMFNSSSTAYFNCTNREQENLSCAVGEVSSDMFSVCTSESPSTSPVIAAAICSILVVAIMVALTVFCKCKKRKRGPAAEDVAREWRVNGNEEEEIGLYENKEEEAS
ncbi:CD276 antigen-like isoform X1 [Mastacembelus armatus]|uniref:CD276 antigen-like isoform X1 n=1 Tax=Mastacembelus armatus TaxID=205130 RepID=UPI000E464F68|nr:CD276 antigen-like isoform X1 [Mastacembelus armatus]